MSVFQDAIDMGCDFFTGVPDSALKEFQDEVIRSGCQHVIATNEGQAVGIAVGAELAGRKACVYLQNSGLGNIVNPITSLCIPHEITPLLVIGHRHTLPQHEVMGKVDEQLLQVIGYSRYIIVKGSNNVK
jgi:phosphonopyruvate decarboxylase